MIELPKNCKKAGVNCNNCLLTNILKWSELYLKFKDYLPAGVKIIS